MNMKVELVRLPTAHEVGMVKMRGEKQHDVRAGSRPVHAFHEDLHGGSGQRWVWR
jgi:hypothetical protein